MHQVLGRLYLRHFGEPPAFALRLAGGGSNREILRLGRKGGPTAVGVLGPDPKENRAFLGFTRTFRDLGLNVPEILATDEEAGAYLQEDLGETTLFQALTRARAETGGAFPPDVLPLYHRVLEALPRFQVEGGRAVDFGLAHPRAAFDRQSMAWDLAYFKYHFLKLAHVPFDEARLEADFETLIAFL
ncbi:MAG: BUD32 family EKC/KEOPS complex subunit, partial [Planctomycetota bacterium]